MGTILGCLERGKPIVVLPRTAALGETRNDHQVACAKRFEGRPGIFVAWDADSIAALLDRAETLIERFAFELADAAGGLVWEHYREDWSIDWDYNRDNPGNIFKPWGFQTGHQTEWAKLLLIAHMASAACCTVANCPLLPRYWPMRCSACH
jgi:hypothetical protein